MSLGFIFEPPPRIRLIRHQTISFFVSEPHIQFVKMRRPAPIKSDSDDEPPQKIKAIEKEKEKPRKATPEFSRERTRESPEKKIAKQKITSSSLDKSFYGCNELLQSIKNKKKLKSLFDLSSPEPNLSQIEVKLLNCSYNSIDEFFRELLDFFDGACENYVADDETQRSAQHFIKKIEQAQSKLSNRRPAIDFSELNHQFQKFVDIQIPLPKPIKPTITNSSLSTRNLEQLAQNLNSLDSKKKFRAECLIRIQCPSLPYYSNGIDLQLLPDSTISSLIKLIES